MLLNASGSHEMEAAEQLGSRSAEDAVDGVRLRTQQDEGGKTAGRHVLATA